MNPPWYGVLVLPSGCRFFNCMYSWFPKHTTQSGHVWHSSHFSHLEIGQFRSGHSMGRHFRSFGHTHGFCGGQVIIGQGFVSSSSVLYSIGCMRLLAIRLSWNCLSAVQFPIRMSPLSKLILHDLASGSVMYVMTAASSARHPPT